MTARLARIVLTLAVVVAACGSADDAGDTTAPGATTTAAATATTTTATTATPTTTSATPGTTTSIVATTPAEDGCADVIDGSVTAAGDAFTATATVLSADTGEEKYADRWEVRTIDGTVLGERVLTHPHVGEQPFTRSLTGLVVPDDVDSVVLVAHDSVAGFCGDELTVGVER